MALIFLGVVLVAWLVVRFSQECPQVQGVAESILARLRVNGLFEMSWFLLYSWGFLSFVQYKDTTTTTGYLTFNLIFCIVNTGMVSAFVVWVLYFNYSLLKYEPDLSRIAKLFPFLLKDVRTNPIGLMNCGLNYIRKFIICVLIGVFSEFPTYFFSITILFTLLTLMPMIRYLPYNNEVQDIFRICQELGLVVLLVLLLFMSLTREAFSRDRLTAFGWGIIAWAIILLLLSIGWAIYLFILETIPIIKDLLSYFKEDQVIHPEPIPMTKPADET